MEKKFKVSVVIPVYNVEKYLAEATESVLCQTIGFDDNIQIIFINDGSTDKSGEICRKYQEKYPDNVLYIEKENGGVSRARNAGIPLIKGKYVNFLDADDRWKEDAFSYVCEFFENHYDEVDVVGCRMRYFEGRTDYHYLDKKFDVTRVIDLRKEYDCIQLHVTSSFIKTESIGEKRFSEYLKYGEDARFLASLILEKCCLGVCREAEHGYRKRQDESSAIQNDLKSMSYYFDSPKYYLQDMIDESKKKYGIAEKFIQYTVMYELGWRIRKHGIYEYLDDSQYEEYCRNLMELMKQIDDDVIKKEVSLWKKHKLYCLLKKHGFDSMARTFSKIAGFSTVFEDYTDKVSKSGG